MRVALEASSLAEPAPAGIARYVRQLTGALARLADVRPELWYRLSRVRKRREWWRPEDIPVRTWQGRWWPPRNGVNLFHGTDASLPPYRGLPTVATLHDLTLLKHDDPKLASAGFRERKRARYSDMLERADRIIAVSEASARDAVELLGAPRDKLRVVHHGVEGRFRPMDPDVVSRLLQRHSLEPGYLLYVGTVSERKNTEGLVRAFAASRASRERMLVLAGRLYRRSGSTLAAIRELGLEGRVRCLDYVAEDDLPALYNGATALLMPSRYEGFGLPVLEALACGVPVLCGAAGAAPEVAGECAVLVDPEDTEAIATGIDTVADSPPATADARLERAANFTWDVTARQTVDVYRELLD